MLRNDTTLIDERNASPYVTLTVEAVRALTLGSRTQNDSERYLLHVTPNRCRSQAVLNRGTNDVRLGG